MRLSVLPAELPPAHQQFVQALRDIVVSSQFVTLSELGEALRPRRSPQRLSEVLRGTRLPDVHEARGLVRACTTALDANRWAELDRLLHAAHAEASAHQMAHVALTSLEDLAVVAADHRLPLVAQFDDWRRLGVRQPITRLQSGEDLSDRVKAGDLPAYMLREKDIEPLTGLRPTLAAVATGDGPPVSLLLVTGGAAAGKTRTAMEAMRAELPTWRLLIPHSAESLARLLDERYSLRHAVVWLDDIQHLLNSMRGLEQLHRLLNLPVGPTVLLATLRSNEEEALRGTAAERLLGLRAYRVALQRRPSHYEFSRELTRAGKIDDPWLSEAVAKIGDRYGIAEWLSAGPELVNLLDRAQSSEDPVTRAGAAIVDAAIDCYRAGYTSPLPEPLLRAVLPFYLPVQVDGAAVFDAALQWALHPLSGAAAPLERHGSRGVRAFDYLISRADDPDARPVDPRIWTVLLRHVTPQTLASIAAAATRHRNFGIAKTLLPRIQIDDPEAVADITRRLAEDDLLRHGQREPAGDASPVRDLTGTSRDDAATPLNIALRDRLAARLNASRELALNADLDDLAPRADRGDFFAASTLADVLAAREDISALTARADTGDQYAASALARLLAARDDVATLSTRADAGDRHADFQLATLLAERGDIDGLKRRAVAGDEIAAQRLADLLAEHGADQDLIGLADAGDGYAAERLATLLAERGDEQALRRRATNGDQFASQALNRLLNARGVETGGQEDGLDRLAHLAKSGSAEDLGRLLAGIRPMVLRYCRARIGTGPFGSSSADEIAQETLLAVSSSLPTWDLRRERFTTFVYRISSSKVLDAYRAVGRLAESQHAAADHPSSSKAVFSSIEAGELWNQFEHVDAQERELLILRIVVGLSAEETAEVLGTTPGNVRVLQHRALSKLRKSLE